MPNKPALIIVDMQYIHVDPDKAISAGSVPQDQKDAASARLQATVIPTTVRLLEAWREAGGLVIYIVFNHTAPDATDVEPGLYALTKDEYGEDVSTWPIRTSADPLTRVFDEIAPNPEEIVLEKQTFSGFESTNLDFVLKNHGIESLVIVGGATGCCVMRTAVDAKKRSYAICTVEDALTDYDLDRHKAALETPVYDAMLSVDQALEVLAE